MLSSDFELISERAEELTANATGAKRRADPAQTLVVEIRMPTGH